MKSWGFIGSYAELNSKIAGSERCVNLYPELIEGNPEKGRAYLVGTPGLSLFATVGTSGCRGMYEVNGQCWAVFGTSVYEIFANKTTILRGTIGGTGPVSIASNGTQVLFATQTDAYLLDLTTNTVQEVVIGTGPFGAGTVCYIDNYFVASIPGTQQFFLSALDDGTSWNALDFAEKEGNPDNLVTAIVCRRQLWLIGSQTIEIWWDSGNNNFPFQPIPNIIIQQGTVAQFSPTVVNNGLYWLGGDPEGVCTVWAEQNFAPVRVSNFAIEQALQAYSTVSDCVGFSYQEAGHNFLVLSFPTANATWVLDTQNGQWHERGYWDVSTGSYSAVLGRYHAYAFGQHLVGDYSTGNIYVQSLSNYTDNGNPIRRLRRCPHLTDEAKRTRYIRMQLDCQVGVNAGGGVI
jgi:hypothetical protein